MFSCTPLWHRLALANVAADLLLVAAVWIHRSMTLPEPPAILAGLAGCAC